MVQIIKEYSAILSQEIANCLSCEISYIEFNNLLNFSITIIIGLLGIYFAFVIIRYQIENNSFGETLSSEYLKRTKYLFIPVIDAIFICLLLLLSVFVKSSSVNSYFALTIIVLSILIGILCLFFYTIKNFTKSKYRIKFIEDCFNGIIDDTDTNGNFTIRESKYGEVFLDVLGISISNNNNVFIREMIGRLLTIYENRIKKKINFKFDRIMGILVSISYECGKSNNYSFLFPTFDFFEKACDNVISTKKRKNISEFVRYYFLMTIESYSVEYCSYHRSSFWDLSEKFLHSEYYSVYIFSFYLFKENQRNNNLPNGEYKILMEGHLWSIYNELKIDIDLFQLRFRSFVENVPFIESLYFGNMKLEGFIEYMSNIESRNENLLLGTVKPLLERFTKELNDKKKPYIYKDCKILFDIVLDIQERASQSLLKNGKTGEIQKTLMNFFEAYKKIIIDDNKLAKEFVGNIHVEICSLNYGFKTNFEQWIKEFEETLS